MADCSPPGALTENIAFLAQFANADRAIGDPVVKSAPSHDRVEKEYARVRRILSFNDERRLAEAFTLVLATTKLPKRIIAVCVEQQPDCNGFTIRAATNSGNVGDKTADFNKMIEAARMEREQKFGGNGVGSLLLLQIVRMNRTRILQRLRSKHAARTSTAEDHTPGGRPIIKQLYETIQKVPKQDQRTKEYQRMRRVVSTWFVIFTRLEEIGKLETQSDKGKAENILVELISTLSSQLGVQQLKSILSLVRPKDSPWQNSSLERVTRKYDKLAQYKAAADLIGDLMRKHESWKLKSVDSAPFDLRNQGMQPETADGEIGLFRRSNACDARNKKEFQSEMRARFNKPTSKVEEGIRKASAVHKKVHAEIQLLFHYAEHPEVLFKPRIVCSSKEACYLCYLFITEHGHYHTPRSHGKFYQEWRLPLEDEVHLPKKSRAYMKKTVFQFNQAVEDRIKQLLAQPRMLRPAPSESTVLSLGSYALPTGSPKLVDQACKSLVSSSRGSINFFLPVTLSERKRKKQAEIPIATHPVQSLISQEIPESGSGSRVMEGVPCRKNVQGKTQKGGDLPLGSDSRASLIAESEGSEEDFDQSEDLEEEESKDPEESEQSQEVLEDGAKESEPDEDEDFGEDVEESTLGPRRPPNATRLTT